MTEYLHSIIRAAFSGTIRHRTDDELSDFIAIVAEKKTDVIDALYDLHQEEGALLLPNAEETEDREGRRLGLHNASSALIDLIRTLESVNSELENEQARRQKAETRSKKAGTDAFFIRRSRRLHASV